MFNKAGYEIFSRFSSRFSYRAPISNPKGAILKTAWLFYKLITAILSFKSAGGCQFDKNNRFMV